MLEILHDADDFATLKKIKCPPIYFLGGSGCILGNYISRATFDLYVTPITEGFEERAIEFSGFETLEFYVLSKKDIIVRKLGRYSEKDKEYISALIKGSDKILIAKLIKDVESRDDFSERVKHEFMKNSKLLRAEYNV